MTRWLVQEPIPFPIFNGDPLMPAQLSKSALIENIVKVVGDEFTKRNVKDVLEALA